MTTQGSIQWGKLPSLASPLSITCDVVFLGRHGPIYSNVPYDIPHSLSPKQKTTHVMALVVL